MIAALSSVVGYCLTKRVYFDLLDGGLSPWSTLPPLLARIYSSRRHLMAKCAGCHALKWVASKSEC